MAAASVVLFVLNHQFFRSSITDHVCTATDLLGFWIPRHGIRVPGAGSRILNQWNLDFGFL